jgi:hypothetical protein
MPAIRHLPTGLCPLALQTPQLLQSLDSLLCLASGLSCGSLHPWRAKKGLESPQERLDSGHVLHEQQGHVDCRGPVGLWNESGGKPLCMHVSAYVREVLAQGCVSVPRCVCLCVPPVVLCVRVCRCKCALCVCDRGGGG